MSNQNTHATSSGSILAVGNDPILATSVAYLIKHAGVKQVTLLSDDAEATSALEKQVTETSSSVSVKTRVEDPLNLIKTNKDFVLSFSLVVTVNVSRPVEETLGEILYEAPPRALIISRRSSFNVKMRSQYREHRVSDEPGTPVIKGIDLHPPPETNSASKGERLLKALSTAYDLQSDQLRQFLLLVAATATVFKEEHGYAPGHKPSLGDLAHRQNQVVEVAKQLLPEVQLDQGNLKTCCRDGYSGLPLTAEIIGTLIGAEGTMLLLEQGRPINNTLLQWTASAVLGIEVEG